MLQRIWRSLEFVWRVSPLYVVMLAPLSVVQGLLPAAQLFVGKWILDLASSVIVGQAAQNALRRFLGLLALQALILFAASASTATSSLFQRLVGQRLTNHLQGGVLSKAAAMGVPAFEDGAFYDAMQNAYQEAGTRPLQILGQLQSALQGVTTAMSTMWILVGLSPWTIAILLLASGPSFLIQSLGGNLNFQMLRRRIPEIRRQEYYSFVLRTDYFVREIKLFGLEQHFIKQFNELFAKFYRESRRLYKRQAWASVGGSLVATLGTLGAFMFLVLATLARRISIGGFALYSGAITQFQRQVNAVLRALSELYGHTLFISNYLDFVDLPESGLDQGRVWAGPVSVVEFEDVAFKYPGDEGEILRGINFTLHRGETLGVVGANGAGKTTLIKLLCGLYRPTTGRILFNGVDTAGFSPRSLQKEISAVFQDFGQYELTATENIGLGWVDSMGDHLRTRTAARMAAAEDMLTDLPNGFDTQLGRWFDAGVGLSGGEWQKVAVARMYFRHVSIYLLDEPSAALDASSEARVYAAVQRQQSSKITVVVSHRFSTVRLASKIVVLAKGEIIEQGTHDQLMARGGVYEESYQLQARAYMA